MNKVIKFMGRKQYDEIVKNYPESTKDLLNENIFGFSYRHPDIERNLDSCLYNADNRSKYRYGHNVAKAWVMEDFFIKLYNTWTPWKAIGGGSDSDRFIAPKGKVTNFADLVINYDRDLVNIEFITDYTSSAQRTGVYYLRDNKLQNLKRNARHRRTLILYVDVQKREFFIVDVRDLKYDRTERWGKPASRVKNEAKFMPITKENLIHYTDYIMNRY